MPERLTEIAADGDVLDPPPLRSQFSSILEKTGCLAGSELVGLLRHIALGQSERNSRDKLSIWQR